MIEREEREGIAMLRIAHGKAGALDVELVEELAGAVDELAASPARAVVLTGTGTIFSAGVDLFRLLDGGAEYAARFLPALTGSIRKLFALPKPVVAAANGHAIAGGCILVAACDYRLMARGEGRIGAPELLVGVPFPPSVLEVLRFALPPQHVQEVVYTGKTWMADGALAKGLVDEAVEAWALDVRALEVAAQMAALPPAAFALTKRQLRQEALERAAAADDREAISIWSTPETHDRVRAYLERTLGKK
jgi:enoyl-CoA hydratase